jgi:hypothetical protein
MSQEDIYLGETLHSLSGTFIEILGGKKWSGPTKVTVPMVRGVPDTFDARHSVKFQRPKWTTPTIRTSYKDLTNENESIRQQEGAKMR